MLKNDQSSSASNKSGDIPAINLSMVVNDKMVPIFFQLLGHGFSMNVQTGCSVKELLCQQFRIPEDYLDERIKTIFLDAKVVDDASSAIVNDGSTFLFQVPCRASSELFCEVEAFMLPCAARFPMIKTKPLHERAGKITLKLLNLVVKELGPAFLEQGIWFNGEKLQEFIKYHLGELKSGGAASELNGELIDINNLLELDWDDKTVFLQVRSEKAV